MTEKTHVNDDEFLNDGIAAEDYRRDVNAADEDIRALARDLCGASGVIVEGGELANGSNPDTFKIIPLLRARDKDLRPIYLSSEEDNIAALDSTGSWNYVAAKHKWSYDTPRGAYDSSVDFYTVRYDDYEVSVALSRQDEANGYVVVGRAKYDPMFDAWEYDYSVRTKDLSLYTAGNAIAISLKNLTADAWSPLECEDLSAVFSWVGRVVLLQFADDQELYGGGGGIPDDLHTIVVVTDEWQVFGVLKDTSAANRDISVRANPLTSKLLEFKASSGTVALRGLITLLGGTYNGETA